ncbi:hypothetical protein IEQ34_002617 [Dendrobium chrysotoxum]|uniref:Uncharacterized protein n=1 Tax=Dendrobium chrysotoxum TaxID=161865 RepID=A0AAV7HIC2_DENCH|nr:hypothetical protein IEQ34_002617 [Dendrobium chrysotoxum]
MDLYTYVLTYIYSFSSVPSHDLTRRLVPLFPYLPSSPLEKTMGSTSPGAKGSDVFHCLSPPKTRCLARWHSRGYGGFKGSSSLDEDEEYQFNEENIDGDKDELDVSRAGLPVQLVDIL